MTNNKPNLKQDDRVIVFDGDSWNKRGDVGDNSIYYVIAKVVCIIYSNTNGWLIDVLIPTMSGGKLSRGHFADGIVKCITKVEDINRGLLFRARAANADGVILAKDINTNQVMIKIIPDDINIDSYCESFDLNNVLQGFVTGEYIPI